MADSQKWNRVDDVACTQGFDDNDLNVYGYENRLFYDVDTMIDGELFVMTRDFEGATYRSKSTGNLLSVESAISRLSTTPYASAKVRDIYVAYGVPQVDMTGAQAAHRWGVGGVTDIDVMMSDHQM